MKKISVLIFPLFPDLSALRVSKKDDIDFQPLKLLFL
jgi:hypothetical protein